MNLCILVTLVIVNNLESFVNSSAFRRFIKGNEQLEKIHVNANEEDEEVKATSIDNPFLMESLYEEASLGKVPSLKPKYGGSIQKVLFILTSKLLKISSGSFYGRR